jgi:hypothetical protein
LSNKFRFWVPWALITPRFASRALSSGLSSADHMMFAAAPGEEAGLAYVREYVGAQLAVGVLPRAQILASFGAVGQADDPLPVDTAELCRLVLKRVHSVQDEQLPRALVAAAREGRVDEALSLLEAGAPWDAIDECGHSAGAYALRDGHAVLLDKLLDAGSCSVLGEVDPVTAIKVVAIRAAVGMKVVDVRAADTVREASAASNAAAGATGVAAAGVAAAGVAAAGVAAASAGIAEDEGPQPPQPSAAGTGEHATTTAAAAAAAAADATAAATAAATATTAFEGEHAAFLKQRLRFEEGRLMDELDRPVMMGLEPSP